jgi:hypothetical protein
MPRTPMGGIALGVAFRIGCLPGLCAAVLGRPSRRLLAATDYGRRLLGRRPEEQFPQPGKARVLVAHQVGQIGVGLGQRLQQGVVLLVESRLGTPQDVFQLAHLQLDDR